METKTKVLDRVSPSDIANFAIHFINESSAFI